MHNSSSKTLQRDFTTSFKGLLDIPRYPDLPTAFKLESISARSAELSWRPSASNPALLAYYLSVNGDPSEAALFTEEPDDNIEVI